MLEQILWFVGNLSGEHKRYQEIIVNQTCLLQVFSTLIDQARISRSLLKTMCWVNSNIGRYKNLTKEQVFIVVQVAKAGIFSEDSDIISDSLWSVAYVADTHDDDLIGSIAEQDLLGRIVDELGSSDTTHFIPALRAVGNILTASNPEIVERCLFANVLDRLTNLLYQTSTVIIKEALWSFSNITAGPVYHVEKFVQSDAFDRILVLTESTNIDFRKEALFSMANAVTGADLKVRGDIYDKSHGSILKSMIQALAIQDVRLLFAVLDAIECLLQLDDWFGIAGTDRSMFLMFESEGGLDQLEEVMKHPNLDIYHRANNLQNFVLNG